MFMICIDHLAIALAHMFHTLTICRVSTYLSLRSLLRSREKFFPFHILLFISSCYCTFDFVLPHDVYGILARECQYDIAITYYILYAHVIYSSATTRLSKLTLCDTLCLIVYMLADHMCYLFIYNVLLDVTFKITLA